MCTTNSLQSRFFQLCTVCFINEQPRTEIENLCRRDLQLAIEVNKNEFLKSERTKVALSHVPFHHVFKYYRNRLIADILSLELDYIFSGHIHYEAYSTHVMRDTVTHKKTKRLTHEITIPTCSYRMGEMHLGVGVAVIGGCG